jgi:hypothetical protein
MGLDAVAIGLNYRVQCEPRGVERHGVRSFWNWIESGCVGHQKRRFPWTRGWCAWFGLELGVPTRAVDLVPETQPDPRE